MNIRKVVAPLSIDQIKEFFKDKSLFFLVDYENSKLKDKVFLTYLSNLDIPSDVELSKNISKESLFNLIDSYMNMKTVTDVDSLNMMVCHILLKFKKVNLDNIIVNPFLSDDLVDEYIDTRKEMLEKWAHFIDSSILYLMYIFQDLNEKLKVDEQFPKIDDANYVGLNVVNLFKTPGFLQTYFSSDEKSSLSFFTEQFTKYMFKGKSFYEYYDNKNNIFIPLMKHLIENKLPINPEDFFKGYQGV